MTHLQSSTVPEEVSSTIAKNSAGSSTDGGPTDRLYQLQSLRFFAAGIVMIGHVFMEARRHGAHIADGLYDLPWGGGVDVFFVISGFIIYFIGNAAPLGRRSSLDFLAKRVIRIVPLYWLFTFAMAAVLIVLPGATRASGLAWPDVVRSLLFIPYASADGSVRPVLGQGWTLNYEVFFYAVFAIAMAKLRNRFVGVSLILLAAMVLGWFAPLPAAVRFLLTPMLLYFVGGMALARFRSRLPRVGSVAVTLLFVFALAWAAVAPLDEANMLQRVFARGVPAFAIVFATLQWRDPPRWTTQGLLPLLGDASYALYLAHPFAFNAVLIVLHRLHWPVTVSAMIGGGLIAVTSSVVVHLLVERPTLHLLTGWYRRTALSRPALTGMDRSHPLHPQPAASNEA